MYIYTCIYQHACIFTHVHTYIPIYIGLNYANAKDEAYLRGKYLDSEAKEAPSVDAVKKVDR
jgi:hypothetical protein